MEWKRKDVLTSEAMRHAVQAAGTSRPVPQPSGFEIGVVDGKVTASGIQGPSVHVNCLKALVQAWGEAHYYHIRWALLLNTSETLLVFLADSFRLHISQVVNRTAGEDPLGAITLANLLFRLPHATLPPPVPTLTVAPEIGFQSIPLSTIRAFEPHDEAPLAPTLGSPAMAMVSLLLCVLHR